MDSCRIRSEFNPFKQAVEYSLCAEFFQKFVKPRTADEVFADMPALHDKHVSPFRSWLKIRIVLYGLIYKLFPDIEETTKHVEENSSEHVLLVIVHMDIRS